MDERFHSYQQTVEDWHWWYRVRRDILAAYLAPLGLDPARATLLDIGCGTGGNSLAMAPFGRVVGLDVSPEAFRQQPPRPYGGRVVAGAERLPFADGAFDVVCALDVIEHLDDDVGCVREIRRVLRPGGHAVFFVPAFRALWGYNDDFSHHKRRY